LGGKRRGEERPTYKGIEEREFGVVLRERKGEERGEGLQ